MPNTPASLVAQIYPLYVSGEFTVLSKLLAVDFLISETAEAPWGGRYAGVEGAWSFWHDLHQHFALQVQVERQFESSGGVVVVTGTLNGLSRITGENVSVPFLHLWTIRGALVQALDSYLDREALARAFPARDPGHEIAEPGSVQIVEYEPRFAPAFRALNEAWINAHFVMEPADYEVLEHPEEYILAQGGRILVALLGDEPVGVCALIRGPESEFELAKMAVAPAAQGRGIGRKLGQAALATARAAGAERVWLVSNTKLTTAIALYEKLGFQRVPLGTKAYQRVDIRMEATLAESIEDR